MNKKTIFFGSPTSYHGIATLLLVTLFRGFFVLEVVAKLFGLPEN
jgi:hypothetical protein